MSQVSVLCVSSNSTYKKIPGIECYDSRRDARTFRGDTPIVAHPPCRAWSAYCAHQAKPEPGERELGLWCCDMLRKCGGVLEQPAHSRLFQAGGLPRPGELHDDLWTAQVWQAWWGYPMKKATWLCFSGIDKNEILFPFRVHNPSGDRIRQQVMSKNQRAATCMELALWLIDAARKTKCKTPIN